MIALKEHSESSPHPKGTGVVGISMGNSKFNEQYIRTLFQDMHSRYAGLAVMLPDVPAQFTLQALGVSVDESVRRARLDFNAIVNKCRRAIDTLEIPNVHMISWSDRSNKLGTGRIPVSAVSLGANEKYIQSYRAIKNLYEQNTAFAADVREATRGVLKGKTRKDGRATTEADVDIGINFLLQELAFIIDSAGIIGVESTDYIYHELMPVLQKLYEGAYEYRPAANTGFTVYN